MANADELPAAGAKAGLPSQPPAGEKEYCGVGEAALMDAIEHVVLMLCDTFPFGYFDLDDIKQEARLFALKALPRYDHERNLRNFLFIHVRNRLLNLQRDKKMRNDPPCAQCHNGDFCGKEVKGKACDDYTLWFRRNAAKSNLVQPGAWSDAVAAQHWDRNSPGPPEIAAKAELLQRLDADMPAGLRGDFVRLRDGASVPKPRRDAVIAAARGILGVDLTSIGGDEPDDEKESDTL